MQDYYKRILQHTQLASI